MEQAALKPVEALRGWRDYGGRTVEVNDEALSRCASTWKHFLIWKTTSCSFSLVLNGTQAVS